MDVVGARGEPGDPEERLAVARKLGAQLVDARLVIGQDHLLTAAEHAERAMREGRNAAKTVAVECLLYAAGERQIADAVAKVGIRADTTTFGVVRFGGSAEDALTALRLTRDDGVLAATPAKLAAFGIADAERGTVPPDRVSDLVLERVALVDLEK